MPNATSQRSSRRASDARTHASSRPRTPQGRSSHVSGTAERRASRRDAPDARRSGSAGHPGGRAAATDRAPAAGRTRQNRRPDSRRRGAGGPPAANGQRVSAAAARPRRPRHIDALDGLRTLAIASVVLYHLSVPWLPSGHIGVVVFLVLTGYLVTSSLLRSLHRDGRVGLPRFWGRRLLRIWPPMAVAIVGIVLACMVFNHVLLTKLKPDLVPSLLFCSNIAAILRGASYFDNLGGTSPLTHLWYLGLDAQFCLVWPALVAVVSKLGLGRNRTLARRIVLALAVASAVGMAVLFDPNGDPTRVYYGLDTRVFAPLMGAWLALAWPLGSRPRPLTAWLGVPTHTQLSLLGTGGLAGLVLIMALAPATGSFIYRGGMFLATLCSVALIASLLNRRTITTAVLSWRPLVWLGKRAFGVYLWHFPLFQLVGATNASTPVWVVLAAVSGSLGLAELSLRLIEGPLAAGWLRQQAADLHARDGLQRARAQRTLGTAVGAAAALALVVALGVNLIPDATALPEDALNNTGAGANEAVDLTQQSNQTSSQPDDAGTASDDTGAQTEDNTDQGITLKASDAETSANQYDPFVIADSVAGDTDWYFKRHCPNGYLDSYVGRQPSQALDVLNGYLGQNVVGKIVVLASFSNGVGTSDVYEQLISACGDRQVYLVNAHIPSKEKTQINQDLANLAAEHDNVHLIDWDAYASQHTDILYDDGTHLRPQGQPIYIDLITNAIRDDFVNVAGGTVEEATDAQREADQNRALTGDVDDTSTTTDDKASDGSTGADTATSLAGATASAQ